jgi:pimeloyl-ACP methyl ester carboxylesterase
MNESHTGMYTRSNGLRMYYEIHGTGTPVILLHSGTENCQMWAPLASLFSEDFQLIAPDSRAHGRTNNPSGLFSYRLMAEDIAQFIQALGLVQPFVAGYSDGGQVGLEMAMNYPGLVRGYMLGGVYHTLTGPFLHLLTESLGMVSPGVVNTERVLQENPEFVQVLQERHDIFHGPGYWKTYLEQISSQWMAPLNLSQADFEKITDPVLFFCGDRDLFCPPEQNIEMYRMIRPSELAVIPNADHFTIAGQFDLVVAVMHKFMHQIISSEGDQK